MLYEVTNRSPKLIDQLVKIWYSSVSATHHFLTITEIEQIKQYVPIALKEVTHLVIAYRNNQPVGFMGINDQKLEMLFIAADQRGTGLGKQLIENGFKNYQINQVVVNEENPTAYGFYKHFGFKLQKRSSIDEQGGAHPILYLTR